MDVLVVGMERRRVLRDGKKEGGGSERRESERLGRPTRSKAKKLHHSAGLRPGPTAPSEGIQYPAFILRGL